MKINQLVKASAVLAIISTAGVTSVFADSYGEYSSNGIVEFKPGNGTMPPIDPTPEPGTDPTLPGTPWDPTKPDGKPNPGTPGPLSIDFASSIDFGLNEITNEDQTYYAKTQSIVDESGQEVLARPNYVQVTDNRGTEAGWSLSISQGGQLKSVETAEYDELTGAAITLTNPIVNGLSTSEAPRATNEILLDPSGAEQPVMSAAVNTGAGTWTTAWGEVEKINVQTEAGTEESRNVTKVITLDVPGTTPKDAVKYQTELTWILTDKPGNKEV